MSIFYGWKISALSLVANFLLQGSTIYCMNAFMEPLCEANSWSRMEVNISLGLAAFIGQLAMPFAAAVAERFSLRMLMSLGALAGGLATCAMGYTANIHIFTFCLIMVWVSSQFCGGVVGNALMSNWFSHFRGLAFGVANSGASMSGIILPFLCMLLIDHYSIKTAFLTVGLATCVLAPLSWWLVRRSPQLLHLHPDGRKHEPRKPKNVPVAIPLRKLVRMPAAWYIGIAFGLTLMCGSGILSQLKPRYSDLGLDGYTGILLTSVAAAVCTVVKYIWGWICDRWSPIIASRAVVACCLSSMIFMFLPPSIWVLALFAISFSCGSGGLWVVLPAVTSSYFGNTHFLAAYKFISIFILLRCLGFPIMGFSHHNWGSYVASDIIFTLCLLFALLLTFLLHPEQAAEKKSSQGLIAHHKHLKI